jgi:hypothetical protein
MNQLTLSNLSLFETTKEQRQQFCANVIDVLSEGMADPLKIHLQVKCLEDIIKQITSNAAYKDFLLTEASKYGKTFEHHNAKFEIKEMGVKYDFTACGDPIMNNLLSRQAELDTAIKERQTFLKGIPAQGMETLFEDELVTLYPPTKTSTTSISVNLK